MQKNPDIELVCQKCGMLYRAKPYFEDGYCKDCWQDRLLDGEYDPEESETEMTGGRERNESRIGRILRSLW